MLRESRQRAIDDGGKGFDAGQSGKSDCASAHALELDWAHFALLVPVYLVRFEFFQRSNFGSFLWFQGFAQEQMGELFLGVDGELSGSNLVGLRRVSVVCVDLLEVGFKDLLAIELFSFRGKRYLEFPLPQLELAVDLGSHIAEDDEGGQK